MNLNYVNIIVRSKKFHHLYQNINQNMNKFIQNLFLFLLNQVKNNLIHNKSLILIIKIYITELLL